MDGNLRQCPTCKEEKPNSEFASDRRRKDGLSFYCLECKNARQRDYYSTNRDNWYRYRVKTIYKMDLEFYEEMSTEQGGLCFLCGNPPVGGKRLSVDHDHSCCDTRGGQSTCGRCSRALLCATCNFALGYAKDDPQLLRRMADYVEWFK